MHTSSYGPHPEQVLDLALPTGTAPPAGWPTVVLLHGGFWRQRYDRSLMAPLATDLAEHGYAAVNVEYRRVGGDGGWPQTLQDVAAAVDHLPQLSAPLDLDRVAVVGHSAGGHLALWAAGRFVLPADAPGADPQVRPCLVVGQAPVADLAAGVTLGDGAVVDLLGGTPPEQPQRYAVADPAELIGHGCPVLLTHGDGDDVVPVEQSHRYASAASVAGDEVTVVTGPGDHFSVLDVEDPLWVAVLDALAAAC